jgi:hypothetical protein
MRNNTKENKTSDNLWCGYCGKMLPRSNFSPNITRYVCRAHSTIYDRWRADQLKLKVITHMGGKCHLCGYNKCPAALDLHHPDPTIKEMGWDKLRKHSLIFILKHIKEQNMVLICSNCHRQEHYTQASLPQWTGQKHYSDISDRVH